MLAVNLNKYWRNRLMFDFWQQYKLNYLRKHNRLNLEDMRRFNLPKPIIQKEFLDIVKQEFNQSY